MAVLGYMAAWIGGDLLNAITLDEINCGYISAHLYWIFGVATVGMY